MSPRARRMLPAGARLALLTAVVASSLIYAFELTRTPGLLLDFRGGLYNAGTAIVAGHDPYQRGFLAKQAAVMRAGGTAIGETADHAFSVPLYPAPANLAMVPLSLLPLPLAAVLFTLASLAAVVLALLWLDVRDWRCHALALASWPCLFSLWLGAIGPFLLLGVAAAWRWRARVLTPALSLAAIIAVKLFPWPLAGWLLVTRRWRALALSVAAIAALIVGGWAVLGFAGIAQYPRMLADATFIQQGRASSLVAVLLAAGAGSATAHAIAFVAGCSLLALAWNTARRNRSDDGDRRAFGLCLIAALTASPIVWDHYMVLLFVPVALSSPRLSRAWLLPLTTPLVLVILMAISHTHARGGPLDAATTRNAVVWLIVEAAVLVRLLWPGRVRLSGFVSRRDGAIASCSQR